MVRPKSVSGSEVKRLSSADHNLQGTSSSFIPLSAILNLNLKEKQINK